MDINQVYLDSSRKQFLYYKTIAEKAMNQLAEESGSSSKKILKALTGIETGLHEQSFFERIKAHL